MREHGIDESIIHATASHGYALTVDICPEHTMEKVLYAVDELAGLIGAAGCSRKAIARGAEMLGWELDDLISRTILAMRSCEDVYNALPEA